MTAKKLNLSAMTLAQLKKVQAEATELIAAQERAAGALEAVLGEVRALAKAQGVPLGTLAAAILRPALSSVAVPAAPVTRAKATVKYRGAVGQSWTGRGHQPEWVKAHLAGGGTLDDLRAES